MEVSKTDEVTELPKLFWLFFQYYCLFSTHDKRKNRNQMNEMFDQCCKDQRREAKTKLQLFVKNFMHSADYHFPGSPYSRHFFNSPEDFLQIQLNKFASIRFQSGGFIGLKRE